jgi:hypothetical protein
MRGTPKNAVRFLGTPPRPYEVTEPAPRVVCRGGFETRPYTWGGTTSGCTPPSISGSTMSRANTIDTELSMPLRAGSTHPNPENES